MEFRTLLNLNLIAAILLSATVGVAVARLQYSYSTAVRGWLRVHKQVATWDQAYEQCRLEGAVLASPITDDFLFEIRILIGESNSSYFLGTTARYNPNIFVSIEGVPLDAMPVTDLFDTLSTSDGACLSIDQREVRATPCQARLPYFCYRKQTDANMTNCGTFDEAYKLVESTGSCYKNHYVQKRWSEAYATCVAEGGYLAVPNDAAEAKILIDNLTLRNNYMYIGLRDWSGNGTWQSVKGDPIEDLYNVWEGGNKSSNTCCDCGKLHPDTALLNRTICDGLTSYFICEKDPSVIVFPPGEEQQFKNSNY